MARWAHGEVADLESSGFAAQANSLVARLAVAEVATKPVDWNGTAAMSTEDLSDRSQTLAAYKAGHEFVVPLGAPKIRPSVVGLENIFDTMCHLSV